MKKSPKRKTATALAVASIAVLCCGGCTVISYNRVFPKLSWYWSKEARQQRADQAQEKAWEQSLPTNSPAR